MMNKVCIIKKRPFRECEIYPSEFGDVMKDIFKKATHNEQIFIYRDGGSIYYLYKRCFSYKQSLAICVLSDRLCTDYNELRKTFRDLLSEMSSHSICFKQNTYSLLNVSLLSQRVEIDIYLRDNKRTIDTVFRQATAIPPARIDIPKGDIVPCVLEDRGSSWIVNQITNGYHNVHLTFREKSDTKGIQVSFGSFVYSCIKANISQMLIFIGIILGFTIFFLHNKSCENGQKDIVAQEDTVPHRDSLINDTPLTSIEKHITISDKKNTIDVSTDTKETDSLLSEVLKQDTKISGDTVQKTLNKKDMIKVIDEMKQTDSISKDITVDSTVIKPNYTTSVEITNLIDTASNNISSPSIPSNFILVPGGQFSYKGHVYEDYKKHDVDIDSFYISAYELTQGEYEKVMGSLRKFNYQWLFEGTYYNEVKGENIPVRGCLKEFAEYCNKRSIQEGFDGFYVIANNSITINEGGNGYRLITPYEWIYAAYGGKKNLRQKFLGGKNLNDVAWHLENSKGKPHPVGLKKPNIIGIYDMQGNAPEILQGDDEYMYYVSMLGGYNISNWNYSQAYDVTYIWGDKDESDLLKDSYGTRIVFIPKGLQNRNLNRNYKYPTW